MEGATAVALGVWAALVGLAAFDSEVGAPARAFRDGRPLGPLAAGVSLTLTDAPIFVLLVAALPGLDRPALAGLAVGAAAGRLLAGALLLPRFFLGEQTTAHQRLQIRFGAGARRVGALAFLMLRILQVAVVLGLAAALVQQATAIPTTTILAAAVLVAAVPTVAAGVRGGVQADRVHGIAVVVAGAAMAAAVSPAAVVDPASSTSTTISFVAALLGGATWATAAYSTDQLYVQRLLGCGSVRTARRAVLVAAAGGLAVAAATPAVLAAGDAPGWTVVALVAVPTAFVAASANATAPVLIHDFVRPSVDGTEPAHATAGASRAATLVALLALGAAGLRGLRVVPAHGALEIGTVIYGVSLGLAVLATLRLSDPMRGSPGSFVVEPVDAAVTLGLTGPAVVWMAWTSEPAFAALPWPLALPLYTAFVTAVGLVVRNLRKAVWDRRI